MRKKVLFLVIFLIIITCNLSYSKSEGKLYIESNKDVAKNGEEIEISINLIDEKTSAFNFSLFFDKDKLDCISNQDNINIIENRINYVWYDTLGGSGEKDGEIAKLKFRAKDNGIVTFTMQGEFYNKESQLINVNIQDKKIKIGEEENFLQQTEEAGTSSQSSNANLQVLRLNHEGITPQFDKNIFDYYITISKDIKDLEVLTVTENPNATTEITGNKALKEGLNIINIKVSSEDKTQTKIYTINVTKTENLELANTNLEILAIENVLLNPPFDNLETNYKAEVSKETDNINILAIPQNEHAVVEILGKENLKHGNNLVTVIVIAENNFTKKKYQVEVYRRNEEEEKKFLEEQKENLNKVEYAYEIEELSKNSEEGKTKLEENSNKKMLIFASIFFIILIFVCIFWYINNKKNKNLNN